MKSVAACLKSVNISLYRCMTLVGGLFFISAATVTILVLLSPSVITISSDTNRLPASSLLQSNVQKMPQQNKIFPTATVSPSTNSQDQQPSEITIANNIITTAGVFAAVVGVILAVLALAAAIATGIGIFEVRRISRFRKRFDNELKQLHQQIDTESQKYIEASYYYSEGTKEYRAGDNRHAIENFLEALKYLPKSPRILERIGRAYSNLNDDVNAAIYLNRALDANPDYEPALRSLALYYRYSNRAETIKLLQRIVANNPSAYESWDFLGLCYRDQLQQGEQLIRDQQIIDKAIEAHEKALHIKVRPETEFYLGILLFFSPTGDKNRAKDLLISASKRVEEQEHDIRVRGVWKKLIQAGAPIVEGNQTEVLQNIQDMIQYNPTTRIYIGVVAHLRFLLEGTGHSDWIQAFLNIVNKWKES